jgi:hypothetical protein
VLQGKAAQRGIVGERSDPAVEAGALEDEPDGRRRGGEQRELRSRAAGQ